MRQALEQLCRYITRLALANDRVQCKVAGQLVLKLKTPWRCARISRWPQAAWSAPRRHAALMQIKAHPSSLVGAGDRAYDDEHDPTVRVENALATEMGLGGARRGLAASGSHRGESLRVFTIGPCAADADDPAPFAAQLAVAIAFLDGNEDLLVDTVGLRDKADTKASVSQSRASRLRAELGKGMKKATVEVETTPGKNETLPRVQPATDGGVGAKPVVELVMAIRPAGLITPIGKAPPATPVHSSLAVYCKAMRRPINPQPRLLASASSTASPPDGATKPLVNTLRRAALASGLLTA